MKINELRNGMLVQNRSGNWYVVIVSKDETKIHGITTDAQDSMNYFDDGMVSRYGLNYLDIVKVANGRLSSAISKLVNGKSIEESHGFEVIWERSNPQITEVQSLITELQGQLKAAQDKLEAIR